MENLNGLLDKYESVDTWYEDMKAAGYKIPLPMRHGIKLGMAVSKMSFPDVFKLLEKNERIVFYKGYYIYNIRGHKGLKEFERK